MAAEPDAGALPPAPPACSFASAAGALPDLIVEADPPPPPAPPRARAGGRRVIQLDELDAYGPIHLYRVGGDGVLTDLGLGSDPRRIDAHRWGYLVMDASAAHSELVVVDDAGLVTRTPGGNGRGGSLGGPLPLRRSPFTRDGRFMVLPGDCSEPTLPGECMASIFDAFPTSGHDRRIDFVPMAPGRELQSLAISDDGTRVALSYRDAPGLVFDRGTREAVPPALDGLALAFSRDLSRVLVVPREGAGASLADTGTGRVTSLPTTLEVRAAAFDPCGQSVVLAGAGGPLGQRVERRFFDGREPVVLLDESPETPFFQAEIDDRGWLLLLGDVGDPDERSVVTWTLPLEGGEARRLALSHSRAIWGVVLGPDASAP